MTRLLLAVALALCGSAQAFHAGRIMIVGSRASLIRAAEDAAPAPAGLSDGETAALREASLSMEKCREGEGCPKECTNMFGGPQIFFSLLRNANRDPPPGAWDTVRKKWPVLASRSDAELLEALGPIKAEYVDMRSL